MGARIVIPDCVNIKRRERCLADPEEFMKTYLKDRYYRPFGRHHRRMIDGILEVATTGRRLAIFFPRGSGKSEITKGMNLFLFLNCMVTFLLPIAATSANAALLFRDFQFQIANNELLYQDFPEICHPVRELDGAPQRAGKQHIDGLKTHIVWKAGELIAPRVLSDNAVCKDYGGRVMTFYGIDSAFRGVNLFGKRPNLLIADDLETRESAKSISQIKDRGEILDRDITGLAEDGQDLPIILLGTIQNSYCLHAQIADPEIRPGWNPERIGRIAKWPKEEALWEEYIALRNKAIADGDKYGIKAVEFYLKNRARMDAGAETITDTFKAKKADYCRLDRPRDEFNSDGFQLVYSYLQEQYDLIALIKKPAYCSEFQNEPEAEAEIERSQLTTAKVMDSTSGYERTVMPKEATWTTMGIDIGKFRSHWTKIAWSRDFTRWIIDYGIIQTYGLDSRSSEKAIGKAVKESIDEFLESDAFQHHKPRLTLIDSGDYTDAVYDICIGSEENLFPSKGWDKDRHKDLKQSTDVKIFVEGYAVRKFDSRGREFWLYHLNTEHWKDDVHEHFGIHTFVDGERVPGSIAVFEPPYFIDAYGNVTDQRDIKYHAHFARHILSEGEEFIPMEGKYKKRIWRVRDERNNHWLDSTALANAAGSAIGLRMTTIEAPPPTDPMPVPYLPSIFQTPHGQPFLVTER